MARLIGVVRQVVGEAFAVSAQGRRPLVEGDRLYAGELLQTGAGGAVAVRLANGEELTLGRESAVQLSPRLLGEGGGAPASGVEQLQQAISAGADPTVLAEPPAAGPSSAASGGGGGGTSFVLLAETAGRVDPEIGYPTAAQGSAAEFPQPQLASADPAPLAAVEPPAPSIPAVEIEYFDDASAQVLVERAEVDEAGLPAGSRAGVGETTAYGRFVVDAPDGVAALQVRDAAGNWIDVKAGGSVQGLYGTLRVEVDGRWSYTLDGAQVHPGRGASGASDLIGESFAVRVLDATGDFSPERQLSVTIADDAPRALDDVHEIRENAPDTLAGSVLDNDLHGNGQPGADGRSFLGWDNSASTLLSDYGTLRLNADGSYSFVLDNGRPATQALRDGDVRSESFAYRIQDADGDTATATLTIILRGSNDAPSVDVDSGNPGGAIDCVYEAGLPGGSAEAGDGEFASGTFRLGDADGLDDLVSLTVNGQSVALDQLVGHVFTGAYGTLTITGYDAASGTGSYLYQLSGPTTDGPGAEIERFVLRVSDGSGSSAAREIAIEIVDDRPWARDQVASGQSVLANKTNLLIVLDISDSMNDPANFGGYNRLEAARQAILELLEQYEALGDVAVKLVLFGSSAQVLGGEWQSVNEAIAAVLAIDTPSSSDLTNYDAALQAVMNTAWGQPGKLADGQNVGYFLSDGIPKLPAGSVGISVAEEAAWIDFLKANGITMHALGMGLGVTEAELDPIAYDGASGTDTDARTVTDFAQLSDTLVEIVRASPMSGSLTTGGGFGADGGHVLSVTVDGVTYTYQPAAGGSIVVSGGAGAGSFDAAAAVLTIVTAGGGRFVVDMGDGAFVYTPPAGRGSTAPERIGFVLVDNDGDTAGGTLSLSVDAASGPLVIRDDRVFSNVSIQSGPDVLTIPKWALLANDTGPGSHLLSLALLAASASGGQVTDSGGSITFVEGGTTERDGGSFSYQASLGGEVVGSADVHLLRDPGSVLEGSYLNEILVGRDRDSTLKGHDGDDILIGGSGDDVLDGGWGDDILAGGAGDDTLIGGAGNDTASYIEATGGVRVSLAESLAGQAQNTGGAGTDRLTGLENLIGSLHDDELTGNAGSNVLVGLDGDDRLSGMGGDDILIGGSGDDVLTGGAGRDSFVWLAGDSGTDRVTDFEAGQDRLDLSDLLSGLDPALGNADLASVLSSYLSLSSGASSTITVNPDAGGPLPASQSIVLEGVNLATIYGHTDQASIIHAMLDDGSLKVV